MRAAELQHQIEEQREKEKVRDLEGCVKSIFEEARMVLPGVQSLFGFQMIAVFNSNFSKLDETERTLHVVAISLVLIAICALMTPAAYDRQTGTFKVTEHFARLSSKLLTVSMAPLLVALAIDFALVVRIATNSTTAAFTAGAITFLTFVSAWFVFPKLSHK